MPARLRAFGVHILTACGAALGLLAMIAAVRGACFLRTSQETLVSWHRRQLAMIRRNYWVGFRPACFLPCRPAK